MNIKPFLTLASERLAGTPHLLWGEAESTSREHQPRGEAESTIKEKYPTQDSIQPKIEGLVLINPFQVFLVLVVRTNVKSLIEAHMRWDDN